MLCNTHMGTVIQNAKVQSNTIVLALLVLGCVVCNNVSSASGSTLKHLPSQKQESCFTGIGEMLPSITNVGATSSSSDPQVQAIGDKITITISSFNGKDLPLVLPANATTWDLYTAVESMVDGGIGILHSDGEVIPNYMYHNRYLRDLGIVHGARLQYLIKVYKYYSIHTSGRQFNAVSVKESIYQMRMRRLIEAHDTQEPLIGYYLSFKYSNDRENWYRLSTKTGIDNNMEFRCVENRDRPYVLATPAFVCYGDRREYVQHLFLSRINDSRDNKKSQANKTECYLYTKRTDQDFGLFEELKPVFFNHDFGYSHYGKNETGDFSPSHVCRINSTNDLWGILSQYYGIRNPRGKIGLPPEYDKILKSLLGNIGIAYKLEFSNLLLSNQSDSDANLYFTDRNKIRTAEPQWLRLGFHNLEEQNPRWPAGGRMYVRNNVGREPDQLPLCLVTLSPMPLLKAHVTQ